LSSRASFPDVDFSSFRFVNFCQVDDLILLTSPWPIVSYGSPAQFR
jgi:hypothetical protein